jgi:PAS domain S-box-containing protein
MKKTRAINNRSGRTERSGHTSSTRKEWRDQELALSESRAEMAAITASAMDAIISLAPDQYIVQFNTAAEEMFSCPAARAIGRPIREFIPESFPGANERFFDNLARGSLASWRNGNFRELRGRRRNGEQFSIEASISQTEVGGQNRVTLVMRDVTERKLAEEQILRLNAELEQRVHDRTARLEDANRELQREIGERRQLQQQLLQISEREQRRIGQDLHDGIGQQLTGVILLNSVLMRKLVVLEAAEVEDVRRMAELLAEARVQVHQLARGLQPVPANPNGLVTALGQLVSGLSALHNILCRFRCPRPVLVGDNLAATHLFRIAQEAVHNAVRHGRCKRILVLLTERNGVLRLIVQDDGRGLPQTGAGSSGGLGLQIMRSRAEAIGGAIRIDAARPHGTRVECRVQLVDGVHPETQA